MRQGGRGAGAAGRRASEAAAAGDGGGGDESAERERGRTTVATAGAAGIGAGAAAGAAAGADGAEREDATAGGRLAPKQAPAASNRRANAATAGWRRRGQSHGRWAEGSSTERGMEALEARRLRFEREAEMPMPPRCHYSVRDRKGRDGRMRGAK